MPKSPKTKTATKPEPERLVLHMLYSPTLTDRESVRAFVRSERFYDLSLAIGYVCEIGSKARLSKPTRECARAAHHGAMYLASDLCALAQAAASPSQAPLEVVDSDTSAKREDRPRADLRRYLDGLFAIHQAIREFADEDTDCCDSVHDAIAEVAKRAIRDERSFPGNVFSGEALDRWASGAGFALRKREAA